MVPPGVPTDPGRGESRSTRRRMRTGEKGEESKRGKEVWENKAIGQCPGSLTAPVSPGNRDSVGIRTTEGKANAFPSVDLAGKRMRSRFFHLPPVNVLATLHATRGSSKSSWTLASE